MPGRRFSAGNGYRYGFNGKENDNEIKGGGNQYDYGFRIYDPRLGKFLSVDPLTAKYPELTPYQFASNTPIQASDLDGLEADFSKGKMKKMEYSSNPFTWWGTFWHNTIASGWNSVIGSTETTVNTFTTEGRAKIKNDVGRATMKAFFWIGGKSNSEKWQDIKAAATNPHTYEDLLASYLLTKAASGVLENQVGSFVERNVGGSRDINPLRGNTNCAGCAIAGDASLKGNPASAIDHGVTSVGSFFNEFGGMKGVTVHKTTQSIIKTMSKMEEGATGVIFGHRGTGQIGHFFNVVKRNGVVQFLDFQKEIGERALNPNTLMKSENFTELYFKPTPKK